jgi:hypothetical protein
MKVLVFIVSLLSSLSAVAVAVPSEPVGNGIYTDGDVHISNIPGDSEYNDSNYTGATVWITGSAAQSMWAALPQQEDETTMKQHVRLGKNYFCQDKKFLAIFDNGIECVMYISNISSGEIRALRKK